MNTIKNKRAFFQSYIGTKNVLHSRAIAGLREVTEIDDVELEKSELFLKPVFRINKSDFAEFIRIFPTSESVFNSSGKNVWLGYTCRLIYYSLALSFFYTGSFSEKNSKEMSHFLREKGYAIGFNNIPVAKMVEYGWIVLND